MSTWALQVAFEFTHLHCQDQGPLPDGAEPIKALLDSQRYCVGAPKKDCPLDKPQAPLADKDIVEQLSSAPSGGFPLQVQFHEFPSHVGVVGDHFVQRSADGGIVSARYIPHAATPQTASLQPGLVSGHAAA